MLRQIIRHYLPLALVITAFCALAYLLTQQTLRLGANEPQIQMAQEPDGNFAPSLYHS